MTFDEWWKATYPDGTAWTVAEAAWNAALEEAAKACENAYAGDEAAGDWPTPEQCAVKVRGLKK